MTGPTSNGAPSDKPHYRPDIDGLRGIAILAVIGYHAFPQIVSGGFVGVDVFFVISGFLITGIILDALRRQSFSFLNFYMGRIRRIFPALIVVFLACLLAGYFLLLAGDYRYLGKHTALGAAFLSNVALWREAGYFDAAAELKPLLHLWSLSIEEQFYLVWPLALFLCAKRPRAMPALLGITLLSSLGLSLGLSGGYPAASFFLPHTRLWQLLLGGLLAWLVAAPKNVPLVSLPKRLTAWLRPDPEYACGHLRNFSAWLGLSLIVASAYWYTGSVAYPGWRAMIPAAGTFLLIAVGTSSWPNRNILGNRALIFIGLISYPLYLWHWPLLAFARIVGNGRPAPAAALGLLVLAFVLAWLTYRLVEKPIRFPGPGARRRRIATILSLAMLATGVLGAAVYFLEGLPGRFPRVARHLTDYKFDYSTAYREGVCFIEKIEQLDRALDFSPRCVDQAPDKSAATPLVLLWGDSMAAQLYPGLAAKQEDYGFRVAQFTIALCPPILGYRSNPLCARINDSTAERIKSLAPDHAILAAYAWTPDDLPQLQETVNFLKRSGVRKIVLAGPVPRWDEPLPKLLYKQFDSDPLHRIPQRMSSALSGDNQKRDEQWREMAAKLSVDYVPFLRSLCNAEGCLTRIGDNPEELMAWDNTHLTVSGSTFLVDQVFPLLFSATPERILRPTMPGGR